MTQPRKSDATRALEAFYVRHHVEGRRLRQSFLERERAGLFAGWIGAGRRVVDLGCRDGSLTRHFTEGNTVTGADIDPEALAHAEEQYGFETRQVNLNEALPFDDAAFDVVVMAEVLEHLPYPRITLGEIQRILKPGGRFIGNVPLAYHLKDIYQVVRGKKLVVSADPTHLQYFTYTDLLALLGDYFTVGETVALKGGKGARFSMRWFARNVAFRAEKSVETGTAKG